MKEVERDLVACSLSLKTLSPFPHLSTSVSAPSIIHPRVAQSKASYGRLAGQLDLGTVLCDLMFWDMGCHVVHIVDPSENILFFSWIKQKRLSRKENGLFVLYLVVTFGKNLTFPNPQWRELKEDHVHSM